MEIKELKIKCAYCLQKGNWSGVKYGSGIKTCKKCEKEIEEEQIKYAEKIGTHYGD